MANNGPVPSEFTKVYTEGGKLVSCTRVIPRANHSAKSNAGHPTGNTTLQQGITAQNSFLNAPMKMDSKSTELGVLPSLMDTGTTSLVNTVPNQSVVFVTVRPPLPCVQRLEQATNQNSFQATSDKLLWVGNNAPVTTQSLQNDFLPQSNRSSAEKVYVPNSTHTLNPISSKSPSGVSPTVKDQLSHIRKQNDAADVLRNIIIKTVSGSVSSSPKCSRPSHFPSCLPQPQQRCVFVKYVPKLLSNSNGKPSKHLADVGQNSIGKQQNSSIKVVPSTQKLEGSQPVYLAKPAHLSSNSLQESNIFYLVSGPNQPPTLISQSLLRPSMPPLISNQNSSSSSAKVTHYGVGQGSPPYSSPKMGTSNTPVVQVKRTFKQEQGSMEQPNKKSKSTFSAISIKKEPEDNYQGDLSSTKTQTVIQNPLPSHHPPAVSNKFRNTQVGNIGDSSSVNANNQLSDNCLRSTDNISVGNQASTPSWGTSHLDVSSHVIKGPIVTSNVAPCPTVNTMSSVISPTNTKQTFSSNTPNHGQTRLMKTFIVTDKSGKTRVLKVPPSTPASQLLYTLSNQCKEKKLQLRTVKQKGARNSADASAGTVVILRKVNEVVTKGEEVSLKPKEIGSKTGVDLEQGLSKGDDGTNKMGLKDGKQGIVKTEQVEPKTDNKFNVRSIQTELQGPKSKSAEGSNILTKSNTPNRKRISRRRRRKKRARRNRSRKRNAKTTIHDHSYSAQPKSCKGISEDKSKFPFKDMKTSTSIDSESAKKVCNFEMQVTESECIILPEKDHNPEKQIKMAIPKVVLKPLKLKAVDHFQTIILSKSQVAEVNQVETKTSPGKGQDSLDRSDQDSDALNFKDSVDNFPQNVSYSAERRGLDTVLPSTMAERVTVSVDGNVEVETEITIRCEDDLLQTPGATAHLEQQADQTMEIPSDLSLMSSKDRIKILRERMRRREKEIEALMRKDVA